jgi:hypothetical protein
LDLFLKITLLLGSLVYIAFGVIHLFWPKIFKWKESYNDSQITFSDTIKTVNYYMCVQIIATGLLIVICIFFLWLNKELIIVLLIFICIILILRIIRAIVQPIRIPVKNIHNIFILLFVIELLIFAVPLLIIAKNA